MEHVTSIDGVRIAYERSGSGPNLILVHGGLASDHTRWDRLVEQLDDSFTVYAMDRRGRGESGDSDEHSFQIEVADVIALAHSIHGPVSLYGVSLGAMLALEAADRVRNLSRLALYEPSLPDEEASSIPDDLQRAVQQLIDEGRFEEALVMVMRDIVHMTQQELEGMRQSPSWPARVAAAHTFIREEEALNNHQFDPDRFRGLQIPTLLLKGTESPQFLQDSVDILHDILPNCELHVLTGQGHLADITAPEMVASALREFLLGV